MRRKVGPFSRNSRDLGQPGDRHHDRVNWVNSESGPKRRLGNRRPLKILIPVLVVLGAMLSEPRVARASSGNSFFETIGISIAVGTVLGASTLPFYDSPGQHVSNLGYGAGAGAIVGLGVLVYGLFQRTPDSGADAALERQYRPSESDRRLGQAHRPKRGELAQSSVLPTHFWMPVVSLTW